MNTRDQTYAAKIFDQVTEIKSQSRADQKKYGSMAHKLPVLIRTAGLAQALAFVQARSEKETEKAHRVLLENLAATIGTNTSALLQASRTASLHEYMRLSQDVMAALLWYKRFAQSELKVEPGDEDDQP